MDSALDNENEFQKALDSEKQSRQELEVQIANLRQKLENSKGDQTEYKSLPNPQSQETEKLRKNLGLLREESAKLRQELKALKKASNEKDSNLKYSKDMLELKNKEIVQLEAKIEKMGEEESKLKRTLLQAKEDLNKKEREIENTRILIVSSQFYLQFVRFVRINVFFPFRTN